MSDEMKLDYSDHIEAPGEGEFKELNRMLQQMQRTAASIEEAEEVLKRLKQRYQEISGQEIPAMMEKMGLTEFTTAQGQKVSIKTTFRASIPSEATEQAIAWLDQQGCGSLVKHEFEVKYKLGQKEDAERMKQTLAESGAPFREKRFVHHSTLASFAKEKYEEGEELPEALFKVHRQIQTKIK